MLARRLFGILPCAVRDATGGLDVVSVCAVVFGASFLRRWSFVRSWVYGRDLRRWAGFWNGVNANFRQRGTATASVAVALTAHQRGRSGLCNRAGTVVVDGASLLVSKQIFLM